MDIKELNIKKQNQSRDNDLEFINSMKHFISTLKDVKKLYELEINEFTIKVSLIAMEAIIYTEVDELCGKEYARSTNSNYYRQGKQETGYVIINGQKHRFEKPRVVTKTAKKEVPLTTYQQFQQIHVLGKSVMTKMLHGVSTRDYRSAS